jgi:hypothetical protein
VRRLAVPGSLAIHVIVGLVWASVAPATGRATRRGPAPRVEIAPAPVPVEIVMIEPAPVATDDGATTTSTTTTRRSSRRAGSATTAIPPTAPTAEPGAASPGRLSMRAPRSTRAPRADLDLPATTIARIESEAIVPVEAPQISGLMRPTGGGTHVIRDRVTTVRVDADGAVDFDDKRNLQVRFGIPIPSRRGLGKMISDWYRDPYAQTRAGPVAELPPHEQAVPGGWDSGSRDGIQGLGAAEEPSGGFTLPLPILAGSFDLTDWAIRKAGGDPYSARKQKILDLTSDQRMAIGVAHRARLLARSGELMQQHIDRAAAELADPAALRAALFELWDECADGEAGDRARAQVIGWIVARFPPGSADAYTDAELAAFDARRASKQPFAPYQ